MAAYASLTPAPEPSVEPKILGATLETILVDTKTVACNGGGGALGHPRVYLNMGPKDDVICPYCSRFFVLSAGHHTEDQHRDADSGPPSAPTVA